MSQIGENPQVQSAKHFTIQPRIESFVTGCAEPPQWYALQTRPRHEKRVASDLQEKGTDVFLPCSKELRKWSDRRQLVEIPLFSCYVFVRVQLTAPARALVVQSPGVLRFVGFNSGPIPIPAEQIENVRMLLGKTKCSPYEFLNIGQRVRIKGGSLDGVEGILTGRKGERRLVVSIDLIQQAIAIVIEGYHVEPV